MSFSADMQFQPTKLSYYICLFVSVIGLAISGFAPADRLTWILEVFPVLIALPVLVMTRHSFPLTSLLYSILASHAIVLMIGGHYTYAEVPFGYWLQDILSLSRNPFDRIGHLMQGLTPALIAHEILRRTTTLRYSATFFALIILSCLGISAIYELIEWQAAVILGQSADSFLGTQGDIWDTQKDMFMALCGASLGLGIFLPWHRQQIQSLRQ